MHACTKSYEHSTHLFWNCSDVGETLSKHNKHFSGSTAEGRGGTVKGRVSRPQDDHGTMQGREWGRTLAHSCTMKPGKPINTNHPTPWCSASWCAHSTVVRPIFTFPLEKNLFENLSIQPNWTPRIVPPTAFMTKIRVYTRPRKFLDPPPYISCRDEDPNLKVICFLRTLLQQ